MATVLRRSMGRDSVFRDKGDGYKLQGTISKRAAQILEWRREELQALFTRIMSRSITAGPSDADVSEFLLRGEKETIAYLKQRRAKELTA